jgi:glycosyltransferase involved in cell wall biosynthesis
MKLSVYITSYNQKQYLVEAIESVLAQTYSPDQIIIVDDASSDGSQLIISEYAARHPDRISPIYHEENLGVAQTRNDALRAVSGDYVTYLDGDDRFLPTKLENEVRSLETNPKAHIAFSNVYIINPAGKRIDIWANQEPPQGYVFAKTFGRGFPKKRLFRNELIHFPSWREIGFYDPQLKMYEDYEMRVRLTKKLQVVYTGKPLVEYRRHGFGLSRLPTKHYIQAFEYLSNKNISLIEDLDSEERAYVLRKLDEWRALLIRRLGHEALSSKPKQPKRRVLALQFYRQSLQYHRYLDLKLLLAFLLPFQGYESLKLLYQKFNQIRYQKDR